ncbi:MAG TPA: TlpA disulfide reductase family protein [Gemmatimonadaceae bacterium]|nr:TlpA disulfide reductase family protein [Gemmatimonadaceae bacterium]
MIAPGRLRYGAVACVLTVLAACERGSGPRARPPEIGQPAPLYQTVSLAGESVSLAQRRGRVVLLNVWATWCHPCRDEIPILQSLHERYATRGFDLIGVSVDAHGEEATIRAFASDFNMTYPVWLDPDERVQSTFLAIGVPATFLIDREGVLRWRHVGPVRANDSTLVREIERALGGVAASE